MASSQNSSSTCFSSQSATFAGYARALAAADWGGPILPILMALGPAWGEAVAQSVVLRFFSELKYPEVPPPQVEPLALGRTINIDAGLSYFESGAGVTPRAYLRSLAEGEPCYADCGIFVQLALAFLDGEGADEPLRTVPRLVSGVGRRPVCYLRLADEELHALAHGADSDSAMWIVQLGRDLWAGMTAGGVRVCTRDQWADRVRQKALAAVTQAASGWAAASAEREGLFHCFLLQSIGYNDELLIQRPT